MKGKLLACFAAATLLAAGVPAMVSAEDPTYMDIDYTQKVTLGERPAIPTTGTTRISIWKGLDGMATPRDIP